jgi:elongation factor Tu
MIAEKILTIKDRGTVVLGRIKSGVVEVGDEVFIQGANSGRKAQVSGLEVDRKPADRVEAGDQVGLLFRDLAEGEINPGVLLKGE